LSVFSVAQGGIGRQDASRLSKIVRRGERIWGAHAPSRAHCGAWPQCSGKEKVRDGEGAIGPGRTRDSTRGASAARRRWRRLRHTRPL